MRVERRDRLTACEFLDRYQIGNRPVIVIDATEDWRAMDRWTPDFFSSHFGKMQVQIYGSPFELEPISKSLEEDECKASSSGHGLGLASRG